MTDPARLPVLVAAGEIKDKPDNPAEGQEPAALITAALRAAEHDAGASLLHRIDSLDIVNVVSFPYADLPGQVAEAIGANPTHRRHGPIGGQTPVQFLHEAAQRIARGESAIAAIAGGEASHTATWRARKNPSAQQKGWLPARNRDYLHPLALRHGITEPITVYPLYENTTQAAWHQTPAQARAESATLWASLSQAAAQNPNAWLQTPVTAQQIATPSANNRNIAWPYVKLMVANPAVNQAAALLVTSLATARAAGIGEDKIAFIHAGASAMEPKDWLARDSFTHAPAQEAVLDAMRARAPHGFAAMELYSCFPIVPKMARRQLGLPATLQPGPAGGLTFHGAPLNNYMSHAAAALLRAIRARAGTDAQALLYGQGGYLTWHHALILGASPNPGAVLHPHDHQPQADATRAPPPRIVEEASGPATLESFTILFKPDTTPAHGAAILRLPNAARTLARIPADDTATLARLMDDTATPIGVPGTLRPGQDGLLAWSL